MTERWYKIKRPGERGWEVLTTTQDREIQRGDVLPFGDEDEWGYEVLSAEPDTERNYTARLIVEVVRLRGQWDGLRSPDS